MAHTKAKGSTKLGRDSAGRRLGLKRSQAQGVSAGAVLVRQRGTNYQAGKNVGLAKDQTLFALAAGQVGFSQKIKTLFNGRRVRKTQVSVITPD